MSGCVRVSARVYVRVCLYYVDVNQYDFILFAMSSFLFYLPIALSACMHLSAFRFVKREACVRASKRRETS